MTEHRERDVGNSAGTSLFAQFLKNRFTKKLSVIQFLMRL